MSSTAQGSNAAPATTPRRMDHYVTLGRSGLRVSPICLGAMTFGTEWGFGVGPEESGQVLAEYLECGGNFIDTANMYTKGHSEKILGDWFAQGPGRGRRDRVVIATKFMGNMYRGDPNGGGAGRKSIMSACEESLRRLRTDYIDLYWAHFWDRFTPLEEMMAALDALVRAGKVRYLGLSDHPGWVCATAQMLAEARHWAPVAAIQIEYSLLQRSVEWELMSMAAHFGMGVTPWSPLRGGVLSGKFSRARMPAGDGSTRVRPESKYLNEHTWQVLDILESAAAAAGCSVAQAALRWVMDRPGVTSTIIGARTLSQLRDNLGAAWVALHAEHVARLNELTQPPAPFPWEFLDSIPRTAILNGTTVNGVRGEPWPMSPADDSERF